MAEELRGLLAAEFDVVATVADGNVLLHTVDDYQSDVVATDIVMPGLDGIAAPCATFRHASRARHRV